VTGVDVPRGRAAATVVAAGDGGSARAALPAARPIGAAPPAAALPTAGAAPSAASRASAVSPNAARRAAVASPRSALRTARTAALPHASSLSQPSSLLVPSPLVPSPLVPASALAQASPECRRRAAAVPAPHAAPSAASKTASSRTAAPSIRRNRARSRRCRSRKAFSTIRGRAPSAVRTQASPAPRRRAPSVPAGRHRVDRPAVPNDGEAHRGSGSRFRSGQNHDAPVEPRYRGIEPLRLASSAVNINVRSREDALPAAARSKIDFGARRAVP